MIPPNRQFSTLANLLDGEFIDLVPHDGNPVFDTEGDLFPQTFQDEVSAVESFLAGDVDVIQGRTTGAVERIQDATPEATISQVPGFPNNVDFPASHWGPGMFEPVRKGVPDDPGPEPLRRAL